MSNDGIEQAQGSQQFKVLLLPHHRGAGTVVGEGVAEPAAHAAITKSVTTTLTAPAPADVAEPMFNARCQTATIRMLEPAPSYIHVSTTAPARSPSRRPGSMTSGKPRYPVSRKNAGTWVSRPPATAVGIQYAQESRNVNAKNAQASGPKCPAAARDQPLYRAKNRDAGAWEAHNGISTNRARDL